MTPAWLPCTWLPRGSRVAPVRLACGSRSAPTWLSYGSRVALAWLLHGFYVAPVSLPCVALAWLPCGSRILLCPAASCCVRKGCSGGVARRLETTAEADGTPTLLSYSQHGFASARMFRCIPGPTEYGLRGRVGPMRPQGVWSGLPNAVFSVHTELPNTIQDMPKIHDFVGKCH